MSTDQKQLIDAYLGKAQFDNWNDTMSSFTAEETRADRYGATNLNEVGDKLVLGTWRELRIERSSAWRIPHRTRGDDRVIVAVQQQNESVTIFVIA